MARRTNTEELIHCQSCGEDYSATYKTCPFCGEKYATQSIRQTDDDDDDGYVFDGQDLFDDPEDTQVVSTKGGKRLNGTATAARRTTPQSRSKGSAPINWPRLITFICSLVIIVAALVIIFTVIFPQIHDDPNADKSQPPMSNSQAVESNPAADPTDEVTDPVGSDTPVMDPTLTRLYMKGPTDMDFTLFYLGETHTLTPGFEPADWSGEVTFTSSDPNYATVDENGKVTNVNNTSSLRRVTITVSAGGQTVECTVYCRGTDSGESAPPVVVTNSPEPNVSQSPSGSLPIGATGTIVNAASGLRVRSGPGTNYEILASLVNGNKVTILADAGNGWYQISFAGANGSATTGYIMGDYISVS